MNDSYGTTDIASGEPRPSNPDLPIVTLPIEDMDHIDEADIRVLVPYNWDSDGETLVGIGPNVRLPARKSAPKAAPEPPASLKPVELSSGPWHDIAEGAPEPLPPQGLGIWSVALPALLGVAGVAIALLRSLGAPAAEHATQRSAANVAAPVVKATAGLAIPLTGLDVRVLLDGQDRGRPPLVLTGLTPGSHALSITGPDFAPFEQPVTLVADHVSTFEPALTLLHGAIRLEPGTGARGVNVEVVGENERRVIESLPARLEAAPGDYLVHARKPGFFPFDTSVHVSATAPEAELTINLEPITPASSGRSSKTVDAADGSAAAATGTLSITSSPPANVVLDGRPIGKAPRALPVPAGSHTVVFVHPKFGRKSVAVNVAADQTTSASVDF